MVHTPLSFSDTSEDKKNCAANKLQQKKKGNSLYTAVRCNFFLDTDAKKKQQQQQQQPWVEILRKPLLYIDRYWQTNYYI